MHCLGCPASRGESIEEACAVHGVDCDALIQKLNAHLAGKARAEMVLDARLAAAAGAGASGLPVADIGCDHGKLTAALACSGLYPKVIGSDLRPGPLAKARRTVETAHCQDRVELRLGDGLSVLSAGEVGTVVIAGVSAQTAWEMLEAAPWVFSPPGAAAGADPRHPPRRAPAVGWPGTGSGSAATGRWRRRAAGMQ